MSTPHELQVWSIVYESVCRGEGGGAVDPSKNSCQANEKNGGGGGAIHL